MAENLTSSVGPGWPPQETSFNRIKGIYNEGFVTSNDELEGIIDTFNGLVSPNSSIDRLSIRMFIQNDVLEENVDVIGDLGEVVISLQGTKSAFEDTSILYLGKNAESRQSDPDELFRCLGNIENALKHGPLTYDTIIGKVNAEGYDAQTLSQYDRMTNKKVQDQLASLYATFGWNYEEVIELLTNPGNIIAVVRKDDDIVSAGIGELSTVQIGLHEMKMAELTEASTRKDHQGKGLYTAVCASLIEELVKRNVGLAYGECNGSAPGVLKASQALGRTFSYSYIRDAGLPFRGYLPQHVPIQGVERKTEYNDLFPSFISREDMIKFVNG